ncbi:hypothetical protein BLOT_012118 [Blomia tropicalis]|nr:hypothetical protein BLOT_012118 [Blomia tropicalis]
MLNVKSLAMLYIVCNVGLILLPTMAQDEKTEEEKEKLRELLISEFKLIQEVSGTQYNDEKLKEIADKTIEELQNNGESIEDITKLANEYYNRLLELQEQ